MIIPIYNVRDYFRQCLNSVQAQTYQNMEIMVVDDGSSDVSGKICDNYALLDERVKVFHTDNHGLSASRNLGLEHSSGEYITFLDSDDWMEAHAIQTMVKHISAYEADVVAYKNIRRKGWKNVHIYFTR